MPMSNARACARESCQWRQLANYTGRPHPIADVGHLRMCVGEGASVCGEEYKKEGEEIVFVCVVSGPKQRVAERSIRCSLANVLVQEHRVARCTERVGESRSHFCGDGCLLAPRGCKRWPRARFLSRVPRSPLCFSCAHRRVAVARAMVREAKRQQRRRRSVPGWWEGADTTKRGATAPKSRLFSRSPRLGRWQLRVAAGYGHRARRQGHFGAWVCLLGSWGLLGH